MKYRKLGRTDIEVSEVGFGAWGIGGGWGRQDDEQSLRALKAAYDEGITFYDTAYAYGDGHSEKLIGQVFDGMMDKIVVASKIPPKNFTWPVLNDVPLTETFPADWIVSATERTLNNLNTDCLDVQQLHAWTDSYTQLDDWYDALNTLRDQGKIRAFGVSVNDWNPYNAVNLVNTGRIDTVQVIYNMMEQRPEEKLLPACDANDIGVIVRVPFEEGLLTGKIRPGHQFEDGDWRAKFLTPERLQQAEPHLQAFEGMLDETYSDLPTLALKFVLANSAVSSVIPGMRSIEHVKANAAASDLPDLPGETIEAIRAEKWYHGWAYPWSAEK
jgi:aryl-alcohol dehydrogenase-like predicted oxidoreductase